MSFEPIRFIHASNLRLDSPLRDVGECPEEFRGLLEAATLSAFERVIEACLEQDVEFLLLTGNSFDESERSLTARNTLLDGFGRLHERGIRVFVQPGELDPADAWQAIAETPDNVTAFFECSTEAVAVLREGRVIATVCCVDGDTPLGPHEAIARGEQADPARRRPFRVGLCAAPRPAQSGQHGLPATGELMAGGRPQAEKLEFPAAAQSRGFDYVAVGCCELRRSLENEHGFAHSPGATQAICSADGGAHGCTLVEVRPDGALDCRLIPTAAVRYESFTVAINSQTDRDHLIEQMQRLLDERSHHPIESLWIVNWAVTGSGHLQHELCGETAAADLFAACRERLASTGSPPLLHSLRVFPDRAAIDHICRQRPWADAYFNILEIDGPRTRAALLETLAHDAFPTDELKVEMQRLIDLVDGRAVLGKSRQFGLEQFGDAADAVHRNESSAAGC